MYGALEVTLFLLLCSFLGPTQIKEEEENIRAIIDNDNDKYAAELLAEFEKKKKKKK